VSAPPHVAAVAGTRPDAQGGWSGDLAAPLPEVDPELARIVANELVRQRATIDMVASENFAPEAVLQLQGSVLTNKYADGYPGGREYDGCEWVDEAERLAIERAKALFGAEHANVQPYSGSSANYAVLQALCEPGDPVLDQSLRELAAGADILINDAQYTSEQLAGTRKGWGHSSWVEGVKLAKEIGVRTLVLFHHDPDSTDRIVDDRLRQARNHFDSVYAATEGMVMTLGGERVEVLLPGSRSVMRGEAHFRAVVAGTTEDGQSFHEETFVRDLSLQGALMYLNHSPRLQSELEVTMETPGKNGTGSMRLRGYVVRIDPGGERGQSAVGIVFTE